MTRAYTEGLFDRDVEPPPIERRLRCLPPARDAVGLPIPRVRDSRGFTHELRAFMAASYRPEAGTWTTAEGKVQRCSGFATGCTCRRCLLADATINAIEERAVWDPDEG